MVRIDSPAVYELPVSVRLALWLTHAIRHRSPFEDAVRAALPDVDALDGDTERFETWRDLGERAVCVDLPRPGAHGGLLPATSAALPAALDVGECLFVPSLGGCLVPHLEWYGPTGDEGLLLRLEAHDSDPVPVHRVEMLTLPDIDRRFRTALLEHVGDLEELDVQPFLGSGARDRADARLDATRWALPPGLTSRASRLITTSGLVVTAVDQALAEPTGADASSTQRRDAALRALLAEAELALAQAATVAALELGGLR